MSAALLDQSKRYLLSFTAAGLMLADSVRIAELFLGCRDWEAVKSTADGEKRLQSRTKSRDIRVTREIIFRLSDLSDNQLALLVEGDLEEQRLVLWFAICRYYQFLQDFAIEVLQDRFLAMQRSISEDDYNAFFLRKLDWHPELEEIKESTRIKLCTVTFRMLREAGLVNDHHVLIRVLPSARLVRVLQPDLSLARQIYPAYPADFEVL